MNLNKMLEDHTLHCWRVTHTHTHTQTLHIAGGSHHSHSMHGSIAGGSHIFNAWGSSQRGPLKRDQLELSHYRDVMHS